MLESTNGNKGKIGDAVEYKAVWWLLHQNLEVFKNVSSRGPIDLMVLDPVSNVITRVDVKKVTDAHRNKDVINIPHKKDLQKTLDVAFLYYDEKRDFFGWSIEEIYKNAGKTYHGENKINKTINAIVFDKEFHSIAEIAHHYKLNIHSLRERRRTKSSETVEQTVSALLSTSRTVIVFGVVYTNKKFACRKHNVNYNSVMERCSVYKVSFEQAIQHFLDKQLQET